MKALVILCACLLAGLFVLPAEAQRDCLPGRLIVGEQGRVLPGVPNRLRAEPALSGEPIGLIEVGEAFVVLEGPLCQNGFSWWRVQHGESVGWTVESDALTYYLEPVSLAAPAQSTPAPVPDAEQSADRGCALLATQPESQEDTVRYWRYSFASGTMVPVSSPVPANPMSAPDGTVQMVIFPDEPLADGNLRRASLYLHDIVTGEMTLVLGGIDDLETVYGARRLHWRGDSMLAGGVLDVDGNEQIIVINRAGDIVFQRPLQDLPNDLLYASWSVDGESLILQNAYYNNTVALNAQTGEQLEDIPAAAEAVYAPVGDYSTVVSDGQDDTTVYVIGETVLSVADDPNTSSGFRTLMLTTPGSDPVYLQDVRIPSFPGMGRTTYVASIVASPDDDHFLVQNYTGQAWLASVSGAPAVLPMPSLIQFQTAWAADGGTLIAGLLEPLATNNIFRYDLSSTASDFIPSQPPGDALTYLRSMPCAWFGDD